MRCDKHRNVEELKQTTNVYNIVFFIWIIDRAQEPEKRKWTKQKIMKEKH